MAAQQGATGDSPSASVAGAGILCHALPGPLKIHSDRHVLLLKKMTSLQACQRATTLNLKKKKTGQKHMKKKSGDLLFVCFAQI